MQKLDRLGWAGGLSIHAYGRRVGIRTNEPAVLDRVQELLPPGSEPCFSPLVDHLFSLRVGGAGHGVRIKKYHLLYGGFTLLARSMDLAEVLQALEKQMCLYVAEYASNRIFVHAGVVGWRGRAIMLPGASRAGKSTLVAALLRAGAGYWSDEYAVLDAGGLVHPFARPLVLRSADGNTSERCRPEEFDSQAGAGPLPVGMVGVTSYRDGAKWRPRTLTPGQAVLAMLQNTLPAQLDPEGSMHVLQTAVQRALLLKGTRGDAATTAAQLLAALDGPGPIVSKEKENRLCSHEPGKNTSPSASCLTKHLSTTMSGTRGIA
jgi:hypothetical protein